MILAVVFLSALLLPAAETAVTKARDVLTQGANEGDADTRREVALALSLINSRDPAASLLVKLAADKDSNVRETAILSIGELGSVKFVPAVVPALGDDVPEVAFAAARTLNRFGRPEGKKALLSIISKETKGESGFLRETMRDVARKMRSPKSAVLFAVQAGVSFVPVPGAGRGYSAMNSMLADADVSARATALLVLATDKSPEVRSAIEEGFNDEEWSVRAAAAQVAALRGEGAWRPELAKLFVDTNKKVRYRAAAVYLRLGYGGKK